jgi:hypothetical protein
MSPGCLDARALVFNTHYMQNNNKKKQKNTTMSPVDV